MPGLRRGEDSGSISVLFGVMMASGALLAMLAVSVDAGRLWVEHRNLQVASDAAALAVARTCAAGTCDTGVASAAYLAAMNADDGNAAIGGVCVHLDGTGACPSGSGNFADCLDVAPATGNYVQLSTHTRLADGSTIFPPTVSGSLFGFPGTTVGACSRVGWGTPRVLATAFRLMVSRCAWNAATAGGTAYTPAASATAGTGTEISLEFKPASCTTGTSGGAGNLAVATGTAGTAETDTPGCQVEVTAATAGTAGIPLQNTATATPCGGTPLATWLAGLFTVKPNLLLYLPVYDAPTGTSYPVAGFAPFMLTGGEAGTFSKASRVSGKTCAGDPATDPCLMGYFLQKTIKGWPGPATGFGLTAVGIVG